MSLHAVTPTRTRRGQLLASLAGLPRHAADGAYLALGLAGLALTWCWHRIQDRLAVPFDEARSVTWLAVVATGALVGFISLADLWWLLDSLWTRFAHAWSKT